MATILVIDDSGFQRNWILKTLIKLGHNTIEAVNGREGLEKVKSDEKPDCITVDLNMPEMDGYEFLEKLSFSNIKIPIVVITADIQEETKKECLELGAAAFLNKPFQADELKEAIQLCLNAGKDGEEKVWK